MQKITLNPGEAVEINCVLLGEDILNEIYFLQTGVMSRGVENPILRENDGIKEVTGTYNRLLNFIVSAAGDMNDDISALLYIQFVMYRMKDLQKFKIPGTDGVVLY
jgi:hypothetical protein